MTGLSSRANQARRFHDLAAAVLVAGGNGIGLSLVKFLVEIFGGTITVTSELQQGTTFTLEFPACP